MFKTLIVEDNARYRLHLCSTIGKLFPYLDIDAASDDQEALLKAAESLPDLVFTTISSPLLDGLELTKRILDFNAKTVIIALTGEDRPGYRKAAFLSGATGYMSMDSCTAADLLAAVECAMASSRVH
ncbi:MAG: response regulator transcription factor [Gammaproteobacteria bacterium]